MLSVKSLLGYQGVLYPESGIKQQNEKIKLQNKLDSFEKASNLKEDKSANGKFDISECAKNFVKGLLSPITAIVKHPVMTIGIVGASAVACTLVPVLGLVMGIGFGALSIFQLGKGVVDVAKNYKNGEYDKAEKSFDEVGQGTVGIATTVLGLKQGAKVAKEAKMMKELGVNSLSVEQKAQIAAEIKAGNNFDALKEIGSLFTSKSGLKAVVAQLRPANIIQRGKDAFNFLFKKKDVTKVKKEKMKFADTTEGKRRAAMTSEEIEAEVKALYKQACDEYGIQDELRPKIEVYSDTANPAHGGGYFANEHKIKINEASYREGYFDLPNVIKHESTHANEAILRQRLPMEDKEKIIVEYLLDKIKNGDKEKILTGEADFIQGAVKVKPPKMNAQMKADFSKLAQEKLYQLTDYSNDDFISMVKPLVESNPEYIQGYESVDDAVTAMTNYAKNHNFRYKTAINNASGFNTSGVDTSLLKELSPEERIAAIKSFKEGVDCLESNAAGQGGILGIGADFNQYQFTPEEVLAQQKGNNFEISKLEQQLKNLRANENYDLAEEARLLDQIKRCKLTIEYKVKGQEMYKLQTEAFNHPENNDLASKVEIMKQELSKLDDEIQSIQGRLSFNEMRNMSKQNISQSDIMNVAMHNPSTEYSTYTVQGRIPLGASVEIPFTTTNAANIIAEDIKKE